MKRMLLALLPLFIAGHTMGQITVDTTRTSVTVKEKAGNNVKTMTIYRSFVEGRGMCNQIVYQPVAAEFGEEPATLALKFSAEAPHIKAMLDAAYIKRKQYNFSRISINVLPYTDLLSKLADMFIASKEWGDYLKKATLQHVTRLDDGSEVTESWFDARLAAWVVDKSDIINDFNALFIPYGYKVSSSFPDDHRQLMQPETLIALGKDPKAIVPLLDNFFVLTKIK